MLNLLVNISDKGRYAKYIQVQKELIYKKAVNFQHYSFWVVSKTLENLSEFLFFFFPEMKCEHLKSLIAYPLSRAYTLCRLSEPPCTSCKCNFLVLFFFFWWELVGMQFNLLMYNIDQLAHCVYEMMIGLFLYCE